MSVETAIALIGVAIGIPSALTTAILLWVVGEIRSIHKRITKLEKML